MKKHILVIDDEAAIRALLERMLTLKGYRVSAAAGAAAAKRIVREDPPQLIIVDLHMEDTDGLDLIEQLKNLAPNVPIMLLTGVAFDPDVIRETISKKVSAYLQKTESLQRIVVEVRRLLGEFDPTVSDG
jgi:DNA-binding NtrC family response regulator